MCVCVCVCVHVRVCAWRLITSFNVHDGAGDVEGVMLAAPRPEVSMFQGFQHQLVRPLVGEGVVEGLVGPLPAHGHVELVQLELHRAVVALLLQTAEQLSVVGRVFAKERHYSRKVIARLHDTRERQLCAQF